MPTVMVNGVDLYYETGGSGPPLVFVPGAANNLEWFRPMFEDLASHVTYVAFDYRGVGRSGTTGPFSIGDLADDVVALMRHLGHERFSVAGLSMGGMVTQNLLVRHGHRLDRAVLISSGPARLPAEVRNQMAGADGGNALLASRAKSVGERIDDVAPITFAPWFLQSPAFASYRDWATRLAASPDVLDLFLSAAAEHDMLDLLPTVEIPVLVVCGTADLLAPHTISIELSEQLPRSEVRLLRDGSHAVVYEHPGWMADVLVGFLQSRLGFPPVG